MPHFPAFPLKRNNIHEMMIVTPCPWNFERQLNWIRNRKEYAAPTPMSCGESLSSCGSRAPTRCCAIKQHLFCGVFNSLHILYIVNFIIFSSYCHFFWLIVIVCVRWACPRPAVGSTLFRMLFAMVNYKYVHICDTRLVSFSKNLILMRVLFSFIVFCRIQTLLLHIARMNGWV